MNSLSSWCDTSKSRGCACRPLVSSFLPLFKTPHCDTRLPPKGRVGLPCCCLQVLSRITHQSELATQQPVGVSANAVSGKHKSVRQFSVRRLSTASVSDVDLEKLSGLIVASYKTRSQLPPGDILFSILSAKVRSLRPIM